MRTIPSQLRTDLINALLALPIAGTPAGRDKFLANMPSLAPILNRDMHLAMSDLIGIVGQLEAFGRLEDGQRPLIVLAETALSFAGPTEIARQLRAAIKGLEKHYAGEAVAPDIKLPPPTNPTLIKLPEAIVLGDSRVKYDFVESAKRTAQSVARLQVPRVFDNTVRDGEYTFGTAWILAPGLLLTNHHVIASRLANERQASDEECAAQATRTICWFDYHTEGGAYVSHECASLVYASRAMDIALLRMKTPLPEGRAALPIVREQPAFKAGDRLNIVQYSQGGALQYAIRSNFFVEVVKDTVFLRYLTDTEEGASGSPVLNDRWNVVAVHHAAQQVSDTYNGQLVLWHNEGIAIHAVLAELPKDLKDEVDKGQGW